LKGQRGRNAEGRGINESRSTGSLGVEGKGGGNTGPLEAYRPTGFGGFAKKGGEGTGRVYLLGARLPGLVRGGGR